ncbi:MAG: hypothetical protein K8F91_12865 [Candidatus Obscuribacterales bacterium]|nr:hypothetical protein [Candidatus Obscuribacterales bacterium]
MGLVFVEPKPYQVSPGGDRLPFQLDSGQGLMGAKKMGMQTAFIARPHMSVYPNAEKPDFTFSSIEELARALQ